VLSNVPVSAAMKAVLELIDAVQAQYSIDSTRILAVGVSMGGFGTWDVAMRHPNLFAAAMPICGGADPSQAPVLISMPIWTFHGDADDVVPVAGTREMVNALRAAGGAPKYTEYPGGGHGIWGNAFTDAQAMKWLMSQHR
jgi:predicted peptidase